MIRTQVSLDEKAYREAQKEAKRRGISLAELVRQALAAALARAQRGPSGTDVDGRPWMRFSGSVNSGDPDSSRTVNQVVYGRDRP